MRRWPCSMNTMATSRPRTTTRMTPNLKLPPSARMADPWDGRVDTTLAKIRIDMPWPMPRWVIVSPSHMTTAVPGRHGQHDHQDVRHVEVLHQDDVGAGRAEQGVGAALAEHVGQAGRLQQGEHDRHVAGGLGQLLLAGRPLVAPLLQLGDHDHQQLDDDRAGDVRHDPEPEDGESGQRPAAEQVEEPEHAAGLGQRRPAAARR